MAPPPNPLPPRSRGLVAGVCRQVLLLCWLFGLAWLLLVIGFGGYQFWHGPQQTQGHLLRITQRVEQELPQERTLPKPVSWVKETLAIGFVHEIQQPVFRFTSVLPPRFSKLKEGIEHVCRLGAFLGTITHLVWVKALMVYYLLPLFLVALMVGAVDPKKSS